jgi:hypothetical protein
VQNDTFIKIYLTKINLRWIFKKPIFPLTPLVTINFKVGAYNNILILNTISISEIKYTRFVHLRLPMDLYNLVYGIINNAKTHFLVTMVCAQS